MSTNGNIRVRLRHQKAIDNLSRPTMKHMESRIQMNEDGVRVTRIDWLTAVASLRLCEAVLCAVSPRALFPAALFLCQYRGSAWLLGSWFGSGFQTDSVGRLSGISTSASVSPNVLGALFANVSSLGSGTIQKSFDTFFSLAATMLVFGFCAIPVMRFAGCRICSASGNGLFAGAKLSLQSWKAILTSSILALMLLTLLCIAFRTSRWICDITFESITSLTALVYIVGGLVLGSGWLLSLAAIAIDRCDGAEALSRGISYVLSRWQRVVIYTVAGFVLIEICNRSFWWLAEMAYPLTPIAGTNLTPGLFNQFAEVLRLSLLLCEIAIAYVLLRNVEDGVSLHEIDGGKTAA